MSLNPAHWTFKSILHPKLILHRDLSPEHACKKSECSTEYTDVLARNDVNLSEVLHQTGTLVGTYLVSLEKNERVAVPGLLNICHQIFDLKCAGSGAPI